MRLPLISARTTTGSIARWCFVLVVFLLVASGCGDGRPTRVPVSGIVSIDGKPLETGYIQVFPRKDRAAYGKLGPGGRFSLSTFDDDDGCVLGTHPAAITAFKHLKADTIQWLIPKEYSVPSSSGLQIEVTGKRDDVKIELKWDGRKPVIEAIAT